METKHVVAVFVLFVTFVCGFMLGSTVERNLMQLATNTSRSYVVQP